MNNPTFTPLESSVFSGYHYDDEHWTLSLQFKSDGKVSTYQQVPPEVFEEFVAAESQGKYWNANIKGKYDVLREEAPTLVAGKPVAADADLAQEVSNANHVTEVPAREGGLRAEEGVAAPMETCYVHMDKTPHWSRPDGSLACSLCHPNPAAKKSVTEPTPEERKDAVLLAQTSALDLLPNAALPPLPVPTSPAEALRLMEDESGLIEATIKQSKDIAANAMTTRVVDSVTYQQAGDTLVRLTSLKDRVTGFLNPIREVLLRPYQRAQQKLKEASEPFDQALSHVKAQRLAWDQEQERLRIAEQERLRKEQEAKAESDRRARGEQLTMAAIDEAIAQGEEAAAAELLEKPIEAPPVYLPPVHVDSQVPKTAGVSKRKNWGAEVVSLEDLILDVAQGICTSRDGKGLLGHAPVTFLEANMTKINQAAKSQEKAFNYPGLRAENRATESVRRSK